MIAFVLLLLWVPSVVGEKGVTGEEQVMYYQNKECSGEPVGHEHNVDRCTEHASEGSHRFTCKDNLWTREDFDEYECKGAPPSTLTGISRTCFEMGEGDGVWVYVDCASSKSRLSTGAIIGITIGVLFVVSLIVFIYRSQLTTRSTSRTGEELIQ